MEHKEGRDRAALGLEGYDGKCKQIEALQAEVATLKAQLVGAGLAPALPDANSSARRTNLAIDPTEVVPPSEYLGVPPMRGPDDPPRRSTAIIEGRVPQTQERAAGGL